MNAGAPPSTANITIEPLRAEHWPAVARIYAEGIASGDSTFETELPDVGELGLRPSRGASVRRGSR